MCLIHKRFAIGVVPSVPQTAPQIAGYWGRSESSAIHEKGIQSMASWRVISVHADPSSQGR